MNRRPGQLDVDKIKVWRHAWSWARGLATLCERALLTTALGSFRAQRRTVLPSSSHTDLLPLVYMLVTLRGLINPGGGSSI